VFVIVDQANSCSSKTVQNSLTCSEFAYKYQTQYFLVRPEVIACEADLSFNPDVFYSFIFFSSARSPRCVGRPAWNFARWSVL